MITLVKGPPDCGKSKFAEQLAVNCNMKPLYYLATMKVMDEVGRERVKKHRRQREGAGFITLEIPVDIQNFPDTVTDAAGSAVVLECVSNLVGNLMYDDPHMSYKCRQGSAGEGVLIDDAVSRITTLAGRVGHLIVVSTDYDHSEEEDSDTALYIRLIDAVNNELCRSADMIYDKKTGNF